MRLLEAMEGVCIMESTEGKRNAQIISDYCLKNQLGLPTHSETSVVAIVS